ncbi:FadR/GntR family transcriptional regulator [Patulibacter defluvii]|uniref:FadR/GntR family transcriptional regulator n=1 Tax=Patulibacter defluvii TaxID=3095358 RepID=UPI002A755678|nr:FCD domain-containing protein [Patulibacter sp. DM4]
MSESVDRVRTLGPVSVPSAADVVVAQLTRAIGLGRFLPGDQLPPEREFAVQLGVSRMTLRAALRDLEEAGLLERVRRGSGGGALVITSGTAGAGDAEVRARRSELEQLFEFRIVCESATAALAAERRTDEQLAPIEQAIEGLGSVANVGQFRAADNAFHLAVADAAGNRWLRQAVEDVRVALLSPLDAVRFELVLPSADEHHREILAAIAAGDPERARTSMIEHIHEAKQEMLVVLAIADPPA